jgi:hypothetical protein
VEKLVLKNPEILGADQVDRKQLDELILKLMEGATSNKRANGLGMGLNGKDSGSKKAVSPPPVASGTVFFGRAAAMRDGDGEQNQSLGKKYFIIILILSRRVTYSSFLTFPFYHIYL